MRHKTLIILLTAVFAMPFVVFGKPDPAELRREYAALRKEVVDARVKAIKATPELRKLHDQIVELQKELTEKLDDGDRSLKKKTARLAELEKAIAEAKAQESTQSGEK